MVVKGTVGSGVAVAVGEEAVGVTLPCEPVPGRVLPHAASSRASSSIVAAPRQYRLCGHVCINFICYLTSSLREGFSMHPESMTLPIKRHAEYENFACTYSLYMVLPHLPCQAVP